MSNKISYDCGLLGEEQASDSDVMQAQSVNPTDILRKIVDEALSPFRKRIEALESSHSQLGSNTLESVLTREFAELRGVLEHRRPGYRTSASFESSGDRVRVQDIDGEVTESDVSVVFSRIDNLERQQRQDLISLSRNITQVETELGELKDNTFFEQKHLGFLLRHRKQDLDKQAQDIYSLQCLVAQHIQHFEDLTKKCDEAIATINKQCTALFDKTHGLESGHDQLNIDVATVKSEFSKMEISVNSFRNLLNSSSQHSQLLYESLRDHFDKVDAASTWTNDECGKKHWELEKEIEGLRSEIVSLSRPDLTLWRSPRTLKGQPLYLMTRICLTLLVEELDGLQVDEGPDRFYEWACRSLNHPQEIGEAVRAEGKVSRVIAGAWCSLSVFTLILIPVLLSLLWLTITDPE